MIPFLMNILKCTYICSKKILRRVPYLDQLFSGLSSVLMHFVMFYCDAKCFKSQALPPKERNKQYA